MSAHSEKLQISLRIPAATIDAYEKIAKTLDRDRTWVMLRALKRYLDEEGADILRDAESMAALDRGEIFDFDAVMDEADEIIAQAESRRLGTSER